MELIPYKNEEYIDWSDENVEAMRVALEKVGGELNRSYPAVIGGKRVEPEDEIVSVNPANPSQVVGRVAPSARRTWPSTWRRTPSSTGAAPSPRHVPVFCCALRRS
jgi:hypothetical protein